MKAQVTAEMILLIAVILAVVAILAIHLTKTMTESTQDVENQTKHIRERTREIVSNFSFYNEEYFILSSHEK